MTELRRILTTAATAATIVAVHPVAAQAGLLAPAPEQGIWAEATRPHFKALELTAPTSIWFISGRMPVHERLRVMVDVPLAHAAFDGDAAYGSQTNTVLGNPYAGVEYLAMPRVTIELGARAPLTTADESSVADFIGVAGEPQRGEAFLEDAVPVTGAVTIAHPVSGAVSVRARAGVTTAIYTGDDNEQESSTFTDYGVFGSYAAGLARLGAGVSGRWHASADEGSFADNSLHQLAFTGDVRVGRVRPGLSLRIPLDRTHRDVVDYSIGAYLQVPLR